jgi:hypothetical protein
MTDEEMQEGVKAIQLKPGQGVGWAYDAIRELLAKLPGVAGSYLRINHQNDEFAWDVFVEMADDWIQPVQVEHTMRLAARLVHYAALRISSYKHLGIHYRRARIVRAWGLVNPLSPPLDEPSP